MLRSSFLALAAAMLLVACTDRRDPVSPRAQAPSLGISDGAHNGNSDFFWMPPMTANPSSKPGFEAGRFNPNLKPTVTICRLSAANVCDLIVTTFAASAITVADEQYHVNWNTSLTPLELSRMYRISAIVGTKEVGFVDVDPVGNGKELRNVNTNEYIGLVDGKTLPIKFRIENGVTCAYRGDCVEAAVSNAGGIVVTSTGYAGVDFPAGWIPVNPATGKPYENVTVKIERVPTGPDNICHVGLALQQFEGCYQFTTDPYVGTFAQHVVAGICPELDESDPRHDLLTFYSSGPAEPTQERPEAAAPFINCDGFTGTPATIGAVGRVARELFAFAGGVSNFLSPKPAYAIDLGWGADLEGFSRGGWVLAATMTKVGGDAQTGNPGAALATPVSVRVTGHHGRPVPNLAVTFTTVGGSVSQTVVNTDANGVASTTWTLGSVAGAQTLTATSKTDNVVTFSATAQQVLGSVSLAATRLDFGLSETSKQVPMTQLDITGAPMVPPGPCSWAVTSNRSSMAISSTGVLSSTQADNGVVTATCGTITASALVESGDFQYTLTGSVSDAAGDAVASSAGSPDLLGLSASVAQQKITFTATYDLTSVMTSTALTIITIDTDQQVTTGHPGINGGGTMDNTIISGDFIINMLGGSATLKKYAGTLNSFTPVTTNSCSIVDGIGTRSYSCTFTLAQLGYDDGYINFKATSSAQLATGGYTGILDVITDVGLPTGTTGYIIP